MSGIEAFDVVVVGGGAAGCVVAGRLAESDSRLVLLLEAGPDLRARVPEEMRDGWRLSGEFDWGYRSVPDVRGETEDLRRSKVLGGTSWLTRFALRGGPADYDAWARLGNAGWGFADVLPYFVRLEADADFGDRPWHGDRGPIPVNRYAGVELTEIGAAGLAALEAEGFPAVADLNEPGAVGAGRIPMSSLEGVRVTTADAYLPRERRLPNLTIRGNSHVVEVLFDEGCARGVRLADGTCVEAGWVVLCAGTYGSPVILLRSGVGPAAHLRSLGIPVRIDLGGVGANLADHGGVDIDCGYEGSTRTAPVLHLAATFHSSESTRGEAPDLMLWLSDPRGDPPLFEIDVTLLRPRSRGTVRLRSADPSDAPLIDLPGLRDPSDARRLAEGYRRRLDVANHPEIRRLCAGSAPPAAGSDDELLELVCAEAYSIPHAVGTCAMGRSPEGGAVVDASGRVWGAQGLCVADASIMPDVPSGFTHLPTIMIAERLADELAAAL